MRRRRCAQANRIMDTAMDDVGALAGIRVVDLTRILAGPLTPVFIVI